MRPAAAALRAADGVHRRAEDDAEELANETLTEKDRDHAEDVHEALEEASEASDKMVNDEK